MLILCMPDSKCVICETTVDPKGEDTISRDIHHSCVEERHRREQKGLCIMCCKQLKPKDIDKGLLQHNGCNEPKKYQYQ